MIVKSDILMLPLEETLWCLSPSGVRPKHADVLQHAKVTEEFD